MNIVRTKRAVQIVLTGFKLAAVFGLSTFNNAFVLRFDKRPSLHIDVFERHAFNRCVMAFTAWAV